MGWVFWRIDWNIFRKRLINSSWHDNKGKGDYQKQTQLLGWAAASGCGMSQGRNCAVCSQPKAGDGRSFLWKQWWVTRWSTKIQHGSESTPHPTPSPLCRSGKLSLLWIKRAIQWSKSMKFSRGKKTLLTIILHPPEKSWSFRSGCHIPGPRKQCGQVRRSQAAAKPGDTQACRSSRSKWAGIYVSGIWKKLLCLKEINLWTKVHFIKT